MNLSSKQPLRTALVILSTSVRCILGYFLNNIKKCPCMLDVIHMWTHLFSPQNPFWEAFRKHLDQSIFCHFNLGVKACRMCAVPSDGLTCCITNTQRDGLWPVVINVRCGNSSVSIFMANQPVAECFVLKTKIYSDRTQWE